MSGQHMMLEVRYVTYHLLLMHLRFCVFKSLSHSKSIRLPTEQLFS